MTKITADQPADAISDASEPEFLPLRGLADILTALLAVVVAFICARLAIQLLSPGSVHYFTDFQLDKAADTTIFGLSILFAVWFYRARINAERHGYPQRRARGWAFWGWIVPFANLHHVDTGGHDLLDTGHRAHVSDDEQAAAVRGSDQCLDGFGVQRGP